MRITRHFVTVGSRRVHYLRAGGGPAVALLHASPCSAKVMRPIMRVFGERFTAIAIDTPGFGLSDKLPLSSPSVEDFADALAETLTALGIRHVAAYGRHTGASIAVEFAARHPQHCAMALADGFPIFPKRYTEDELARYLEPIEPAWDGTHLVRLWFRYRDQHVFWPWNQQTADTRSDADVPDLEFLQRGVLELLEAGNDYRIGYAAPFRHRALGVLADLEVPVCFGNRPGDSMYRTLHLYPESVWVRVMPRDLDAATLAEREVLERHPARGSPPPPPRCAPLPGRTTTDYVDIGSTQVLTRSTPLTSGIPLLVVHHAPGSSFLYDDLVLALGNAIALDLPGNGESDPLPGNPQNPATWAASIEQALGALGVDRVFVYGHNGGAAAALECALRLGDRVRGLALDAPCFLDDQARERLAPRYAPPVTPVWDGSHWLRAWHHCRDAELWWPWLDRRHAAARRTSRIDPALLTLRVREAMKQPDSYRKAWEASLGYAWRERLRAVGTPILLMAAHEDVFAHLLPSVERTLTGLRATYVADNAAARARALNEWRAT